MKKFKIFGKTYTWKFENMHPILQGICMILGIIATAGYILGGMWLLYMYLKLVW